ncbi:hypothetical protein CC80DRAFT_552411 [Byssothecium circinans]|uniref:Tc1-like transposase DDE domain-containing protein n=1 Tax=Byssothecium circinans TaxID=147558 RepID=A0A6A5TJF0_9PLEO|nr:hypothetical protein CC80DRAFT_552411 [Byssothecium circinans]
MLPKPKPPRKPTKSKYETQETFNNRLREWEAKLPPPVTQEAQGNHMTQKYYAKNEDNDPSHGTRSVDNDPNNLRNSSWIDTIVHPAQSPDLNPQEGCWNILKQRTKRRLWRPKTHPSELSEGEQPEEAWDGTLKHLKRILTQEWDKITLQEIRTFIAEMPARCNAVIAVGGERIRSDVW